MWKNDLYSDSECAYYHTSNIYCIFNRRDNLLAPLQLLEAHNSKACSLRHPDIPSTIPTTVRFYLGERRTGVRSCNHRGMMHFKAMHLENWHTR